MRFRNDAGSDIKVLERKLVALSTFPPKIPDNVTTNRSQVFELRDRHLNSRFIERIKI